MRENLDPFNEHTDAECIDVLRRVHLITDSTSVSRGASATSSRIQSRAASVFEGNEGAAAVASAATSITEVDVKSRISLDTAVSPGGTNFSQGQRQLIAMARALLRRSSIIVLDEATSSIDFATDAKIQTTIREEFGGSLLLTGMWVLLCDGRLPALKFPSVAHRLRTVIDYDRLIVLDKGKVCQDYHLTPCSPTHYCSQVAEFDTPYNLIQTENGIFRQMCLKSGSFSELEAAAAAKAAQGGHPVGLPDVDETSALAIET